MFPKTCPFRSARENMAFGYTKCGSSCGVWDDELKQCSIVTIADSLSTINSNISQATKL